MQRIRRFLTVFVALGVATAPFVSFAAVPHNSAPATEQASGPAGMPDCHGMKSEQPKPIEHNDEHCPKCKSGVCTPSACQLKCFSVLGELPREPGIALPAPARLGFFVSADFDAIHLRPPLPPPRA